MWIYPNAMSVQWSSPAVAYGTVYIGTSVNTTALNYATGKGIWNNTPSDEPSSPAVLGDYVYVGSTANGAKSPVGFYALYNTTGSTYWTNLTSTVSQVASSAAVAPPLDFVFVGIDNNVDALWNGPNSVNGIHFKGGTTFWSYPTGGYVWSSPAVAGGIVYVGSADGNVYALNATPPPYPHLTSPTTSAQLLWNFTTNGPVTSSPAVAGGIVYVGSADGNVYALNASAVSMSKKARLIWNYTTGGWVESSPAVAGGIVYVGSADGNVYALKASAVSMSKKARLIWNYTTGGWVESSPAVAANGIVYVGSDDGYVYALNASTGALVWKFNTGVGVLCSPAIVNGTVYVGSGRNVYAFSVVPVKVVRVNLDVSVTNTSEVYPYTTCEIVPAVSNTTGTMMWQGATAYIDFNFSINIKSMSIPIIWLGIGVEKVSPYITDYTPAETAIYNHTFTYVAVYSISTVGVHTYPVVFNDSTATNGTWTIVFSAEPIGTGVYATSSSTLSVSSPYTVIVRWPGDADGSGTVDASDFFILEKAWGTSAGQKNYDPRVDFNQDGVVDASDYFVLEKAWGMVYGTS
jgi:outer membrane protein assembly factor BamB